MEKTTQIYLNKQGKSQYGEIYQMPHQNTLLLIPLFKDGLVMASSGESTRETTLRINRALTQSANCPRQRVCQQNILLCSKTGRASTAHGFVHLKTAAEVQSGPLSQLIIAQTCSNWSDLTSWPGWEAVRFNNIMLRQQNMHFC